METINDSTEKYTAKVISLLVAVIVVALICIPIVNGLTQERVDVDQVNENPIGVDLSYFNLDKPHSDKAINVTLADNTLTFSGDYVGEISADTDFVIECSNIDSLFVRNGHMYYFNGEKTKPVDSFILNIVGKTINNRNASYVYFPETDGKFASFDSYEYSIIDCIGVGSFAGMTIVSNDNTITVSNLDGFKATVDKDDNGTYGVDYDEI